MKDDLGFSVVFHYNGGRSELGIIEDMKHMLSQKGGNTLQFRSEIDNEPVRPRDRRIATGYEVEAGDVLIQFASIDHEHEEPFQAVGNEEINRTSSRCTGGGKYKEFT